MPPAGSAAYPRENMRRTYCSTRLDARIRGSKQTPPKKGTKKRLIMVSENPSARLRIGGLEHLKAPIQQVAVLFRPGI